MVRELEHELIEIEAICASIETAIGQEDWESATACNASLQASLRRLDGSIRAAAAKVSDESLNAVYARLESVLGHHRKLTLALRDLRDESIVELKIAQTGRRVSRHYLETASH